MIVKPLTLVGKTQLLLVAQGCTGCGEPDPDCGWQKDWSVTANLNIGGNDVAIELPMCSDCYAAAEGNDEGQGGRK